MDKKWKKDEMKELLQKNDNAVMKGLLVVYSLQSDGEKEIAETVEHNGVGFTGFDAEFLTSLARQLLTSGRLSARQMVFARKKMLKYAGQLAKVANGKIQVGGMA